MYNILEYLYVKKLDRNRMEKYYVKFRKRRVFENVQLAKHDSRMNMIFINDINKLRVSSNYNKNYKAKFTSKCPDVF